MLVLGEPVCQMGVLVFGKVRGRVINGPEDDLDLLCRDRPGPWAGADATLM